MELEVFEILERFENITSKNERVAYLREQSIPALKDVVRGCFDESLEFVLPAGTPPYTPNRPESTPSSLRKLHRQFGDYVRGARSVLHNIKSKESLCNYSSLFTQVTHLLFLK